MSLNKLIGYRGKRLRIEDFRNFSRCGRFFSHDNSFLSAQCKKGNMTDQPGATKDGVCRRSLLKSVPMIAGAIISATAIPDSLFAQTKLSHEASKYQDQP